MKEIVDTLPHYDYLYLGDNARTPYGSRSFETVYRYTLQCVEWFFEKGCPLVILACNTASAKALRSIQQNDLHRLDPTKRVLGVIRPTAEIIGQYSKSKHIGVLGTTGTVNSLSYVIEIEKFFPGVKVHQQACPMWVPIVENREYDQEGADYFVKKYTRELLESSPEIDCILLACTHYPLLYPKIRETVPSNIQILSQGQIVADSLGNYLERHPEIEKRLSKNEGVGLRQFYTTDSTEDFDNHASIFFGTAVKSEHVEL